MNLPLAFCIFLAFARQLIGARAANENDLNIFAANKETKKIVPEVEEQQAQNFWVRSRLESISWRRNCITSTLCAEPRFAMAHARPKTDEKITADWHVGRTFILEKPIELSSVWHGGALADISVQAFITGFDPMFRFTRLCDKTPYVHAFFQPFHQLAQRRQRISATEKEDESSRTIVELRANCFNATLSVQKFEGIFAHSERDARKMPKNEEEKKLSYVLIVFFTVATVLNVLTFLFTLHYCTRARRLLSTKRHDAHNSQTSSTSTFLAYERGGGDGKIVGYDGGDKPLNAKKPLNAMENSILDENYDIINDSRMPDQLIHYSKSFLRFPEPNLPLEKPAPYRRKIVGDADNDADGTLQRHSHVDFYRVRAPRLARSQQQTRSLVISGNNRRVRLPATKCCDSCFLDGQQQQKPQQQEQQQQVNVTPTTIDVNWRLRHWPPTAADCSCSFSPSSTSSSALSYLTRENDSGMDSIV